MRSTVALLLLLSAAFAGCSAAEPASTGTGPLDSREPIPDAGSIEGIVVDDTTSPLAGVLLALSELGLQTQSDESGAFRFTNIPPGRHTINAVKLGFNSAAKSIEVLANEATTGAVITLSAIPIVAPYVETFGPFAGYYECHVGSFFITSCSGETLHRRSDIDKLIFPNNNRFLLYTLSSDDWATQWGEARWSPAAAGTASGMAIYPSYSKRYEDGQTGHYYCEADGNSPIWFRYDADPEKSVCTTVGGDDPPAVMATNPLMLVADPGFQNVGGGEAVPRFHFQQRFEAVMTIFYAEPAPEQFTAFPDA